MLWASEKTIFQFLANFSVTKLKPVFGKVSQSVQNYLNQNLVKESLQENGLEATLSWKTNILSVWKEHFPVFFANFGLTNLESFLGKVKQSVQNFLNYNLVRGSFLEKGFEGTLISKTNVLSIQKEHFLLFCKFLSDEVENNFWESETKRSKNFKSKLDHRELPGKLFGSYLELKK